jgi:hypothetical protein
MPVTDLLRFMEMSRRKTLELLDAVAKAPAASAILAWRPGPGRAHIAWQLMHVAATDDRHLNMRMKGGQAREPELVRRFAGGSTPDDDIPSIDAIRRYLTEQRSALFEHLHTLSDAALETKPNDQAPWTYREWIEVLTWHEAHHHGQAHLTFNLYRAAHDAGLPKVGH